MAYSCSNLFYFWPQLWIFGNLYNVKNGTANILFLFSIIVHKGDNQIWTIRLKPGKLHISLKAIWLVFRSQGSWDTFLSENNGVGQAQHQMPTSYSMCRYASHHGQQKLTGYNTLWLHNHPLALQTYQNCLLLGDLNYLFFS